MTEAEQVQPGWLLWSKEHGPVLVRGAWPDGPGGAAVYRCDVLNGSVRGSVAVRADQVLAAFRPVTVAEELRP